MQETATIHFLFCTFFFLQETSQHLLTPVRSPTILINNDSLNLRTSLFHCPRWSCRVYFLIDASSPFTRPDCSVIGKNLQGHKHNDTQAGCLSSTAPTELWSWAALKFYLLLLYEVPCGVTAWERVRLTSVSSLALPGRAPCVLKGLGGVAF